MKLRYTFTIILQRSNLSKFTRVIQQIREHKLQLKDKTELPHELNKQFKDYQNYQQWCDDVKTAVETQKDLVSTFNLDIMPFIDFLLLYDKCIETIPDNIIESVFQQIRQKQQSSTRLTNLLRLGARQQKLLSLPRQDLVQVCLNLQTSTMKVQYLFFHALSQLTRLMVEDPYSIGYNQATIILNALNDLNILKELSLQNPKWLHILTRICLRSLRYGQPSNLAIISQSFTKLDNRTILLLCSKVEEVLQTKPSPKDLIMIFWNISAVHNKQDKRFLDAIRAIMSHKDVLRQLQKTADYVQLLSVLHKLQSEGINDYEEFQEEVFNKLKGIITKSQSFENVINFYVIALKQQSFQLDEAQKVFQQILSFRQYDHQMFSIALLETVTTYPQIIKLHEQTLNLAIRNSVNNRNIANYYLTILKYNINDDLNKFLEDQLYQRIKYVNFWAIKLIAAGIEQSKQIKFFHEVLKAKTEVVIQDKSELIGQELGLAGFLMEFRLELLKLKETTQFLELYLQKCLTVIEKTRGVGNIIFVASQSQVEGKIIMKAIYDIQDQIECFNHTELFNYFYACISQGVEDQIIHRVDYQLANKICTLSETDMNNFVKHIQSLSFYKTVEDKLPKTSKIMIK